MDTEKGTFSHVVSPYRGPSLCSYSDILSDLAPEIKNGESVVLNLRLQDSSLLAIILFSGFDMRMCCRRGA